MKMPRRFNFKIKPHPIIHLNFPRGSLCLLVTMIKICYFWVYREHTVRRGRVVYYNMYSLDSLGRGGYSYDAKSNLDFKLPKVSFDPSPDLSGYFNPYLIWVTQKLR